MVNDALVLILERNAFYKRLHMLVLGAFALNVLVIFMLIGTLGYLLKNPVKPLYFAADQVGRLMQIVPVNIANMSREEVSKWTVHAVESAFSYDYINYREQLQGAQKYFTNYGWKKYMAALTQSSNMLALTNRKQIVIAHVIDQPKLKTEAMLGGALAWQYEMPLLVIYSMPPYDGSNQFSNALIVNVIVQRQQILVGDNGLGIVQLISRMPDANTNQMQQI